MLKNLFFILFVAGVVNSQVQNLVYDYTRQFAQCGNGVVGNLQHTAAHIHCHLVHYNLPNPHTLTRQCGTANIKGNRGRTCGARTSKVPYTFPDIDPANLRLTALSPTYTFCRYKRVIAGLTAAGMTQSLFNGALRWDLDEHAETFDNADPMVQICDEYPFASSAEGGNRIPYSLLCVSEIEGSLQGQLNGRFYEGKDPYLCDNVVDPTKIVRNTDQYTVSVINIPPNFVCANYDVYYK